MVDISLTMVIQWINFGALLLVLYFILYKPLLAFLDKRALDIKTNIDQAQEKHKKANELLSQYEARIRSVEKETQQFMENVKGEALKEKHKIIKQAEEEAAAALDRATKEIASDIEHARNELRRDFSRVTVLCAEKILAKEVNQKDHEACINKFLESELT